MVQDKMVRLANTMGLKPIKFKSKFQGFGLKDWRALARSLLELARPTKFGKIITSSTVPMALKF